MRTSRTLFAVTCLFLFGLLTPTRAQFEDILGDDVPGQEEVVNASLRHTVVIRYNPEVIRLSDRLLNSTLEARRAQILKRFGDQNAKAYQLFVNDWGAQPPGVLAIQMEIQAELEPPQLKKLFEAIVAEMSHFLEERLVDEPRGMYIRQFGRLKKMRREKEQELQELRERVRELEASAFEGLASPDDLVSRWLKLRIDQSVDEIRNEVTKHQLAELAAQREAVTDGQIELSAKLREVEHMAIRAEDLKAQAEEKAKLNILLEDVTVEKKSLSDQLQRLKDTYHQLNLDRAIKAQETESTRKLLDELRAIHGDAQVKMPQLKSDIAGLERELQSLREQISRIGDKLEFLSELDVRVWD